MEKKEFNRECRFYEKVIPEEGDHVVVTIKEVNEYSIIVELLEYGRIEGMITQAEYSRTRRSKYNQGILKAKKMKKKDFCQVIRVDKEKQNIDLSKKRIQNENIKEVEELFDKGKKV